MPLLPGGGSPPHPTNSASKHSSVEVLVSVCMASDPTPTQYAEDADELSSKYQVQQASCHATVPSRPEQPQLVFDLGVITSPCPQKLTIITL